jgi:hypothetical protein
MLVATIIPGGARAIQVYSRLSGRAPDPGAWPESFRRPGSAAPPLTDFLHETGRYPHFASASGHRRGDRLTANRANRLDSPLRCLPPWGKGGGVCCVADPSRNPVADGLEASGRQPCGEGGE